MKFLTFMCLLLAFCSEILTESEIRTCSCDFRVDGLPGSYKGTFLTREETRMQTCEGNAYLLCAGICFVESRLRFFRGQLSWQDPKTGKSFGQGVCEYFNTDIDNRLGGFYGETYCVTRSRADPQMNDYYNYTINAGNSMHITCKNGTYIVPQNVQTLDLKPYVENEPANRSPLSLMQFKSSSQSGI